MKDYKHRLFSGFIFALQALPAVLAKKEDAIAPEDLSMDLKNKLNAHISFFSFSVYRYVKKGEGLFCHICT